jgi:hypothetical protein
VTETGGRVGEGGPAGPGVCGFSAVVSVNAAAGVQAAPCAWSDGDEQPEDLAAGGEEGCRPNGCERVGETVVLTDGRVLEEREREREVRRVGAVASPWRSVCAQAQLTLAIPVAGK